MNAVRKAITRISIVFVIAALILQFAPATHAAGREAELNAKIQQIVTEIPSSYKTDSEKALYLHDYIVKNVKYKMQGEHQTAYGALLDGVAVCAGYADAYKLLLKAVGIEAHTITGQSYNPQGVLENHAWTMLYIDGKCLFTDVTWDDPFVDGAQSDNFVSHEYFNITLEQMNKDHFPDAESKKLLPASCKHTGYDFYSVYQGEGTGYGVFTQETTAAEAAKYFKYIGVVDGVDTFVCEFHYDHDNINGWINSNWTDIAINLRLGGRIGASFQIGSSTVVMTITGTLDKTVYVTGVTLNKTNVTLTAEGETVQLTATISPSDATYKTYFFQSSNKNVATVTQDGLVTAVGNGTATITVTTSEGGKTATCTVTVSIAPKPTEPTTPPTQPPTQPSQPTTPPTNPTDPVNPTNPIDPTDPTDPIDPIDPIDPTEPVDPTDPTDPTDPSDPVTSTEPTDEPVDPAVTEPTQTPTDATEPTVNSQTKPSETEAATSGQDVSPTDAPKQEETKSSNKTTTIIIVSSATGISVIGIVIAVIKKFKLF